MNTTKRLVFAVALTLLAGLFWSAQAQVMPPSKAISVQGIETTIGTAENDKGDMYGCTWLGKTSGYMPGSFFMSMNYTRSSGAFIGISPPQPISLSDTITGGTWSLPVYVYNRYVGALYGHVDSGTMEWKDTGGVAAVDMMLVIDGGTKAFTGVSGKGTFSGTLNRITKDKPTISGQLLFGY